MTSIAARLFAGTINVMAAAVLDVLTEAAAVVIASAATAVGTSDAAVDADAPASGLFSSGDQRAFIWALRLLTLLKTLQCRRDRRKRGSQCCTVSAIVRRFDSISFHKYLMGGQSATASDGHADQSTTSFR